MMIDVWWCGYGIDVVLVYLLYYLLDVWEVLWLDVKLNVWKVVFHVAPFSVGARNATIIKYV